MIQKLIDEAKAYWDAGNSIDAGRILYELMHRKHRPAWAAEMLTIACRYIPPATEIEAVLEIANDPSRWHEAHDAFDAVRRNLTLQYEKRVRGRPEQDPTSEERLYYCVLMLTENTAKVTYNASLRPAPFDANSGWYIPYCLDDVLKYAQDPELTREKAWSMLSCEKYFQP